MLRRTVFTSCVTDLNGKGTPSGQKGCRPYRSHLDGLDGGGTDYAVLRGTSSGGTVCVDRQFPDHRVFRHVGVSERE